MEKGVIKKFAKGMSAFHPDHPAHTKNPRNKFSMNILKNVVGKEKAEKAFQTISMGFIPGSMSNFTLNRKRLARF